ncbi:MAG: amylo-alpha-1,6-glucosidase [Patescibacteria group bacterium]|nr:amylo-alpha-1,6-glucosidase [Patescibacteria group bacterium]
MKITHQYKNTKVQKEIDNGIGLVLGNNLGNYFYLTDEEETRYQGFFYADGENYKSELAVYKIIDRINILNSSELIEIKNSFFEVERKYKNRLSEKYFMPSGYNSLCLKTSRKVKAEIILDVRHPYDSRQMGRFYDLKIKKDCALVKFTKRRDWQEDGLGDKKEFTLYLAIKTDQDGYQKIEEFFSKYYKKDDLRNSYPCDRFVYKALEIDFKTAVFSVSKTVEGAIKEVKKVFRDFEKMRKKEKKNINKKLQPFKINDKEIKMSCLCAQNSVCAMMVENNNKKGVYAGLPWFFQFWSRDEAISLLQICKLDKKLAEEIILSQMDTVLDSGQVSKQRFCNLSNNDLQSADALSWLVNRTWKIFNTCEISKSLKEKIAGEIMEKLEKTVSALVQKRTVDDLIISYKNETWMDSLERDGARIEIQAGVLQAYDFLYKFTKNDQYKILRDDLKKKVREKFYDGEILFDSPQDKTIRPNIFLAAYLYPELLSKEEWERCFDKILPRLYLEWGGISSIDKTSEQFIKQDTGENSASYHNGNSWYWVNNLTALVLYRFNASKYLDYINTIMEASTNEILYGGICGHHSEVSSAEKQTSSGCGAQLWSNAMYLEVFDEVMGE